VAPKTIDLNYLKSKPQPQPFPSRLICRSDPRQTCGWDAALRSDWDDLLCLFTLAHRAPFVRLQFWHEQRHSSSGVLVLPCAVQSAQSA